MDSFKADYNLLVHVLNSDRFLNGVNNGTRFEGTYLDGVSPNQGKVYGSCDLYTDSSTWNATFKAELMDLAYATMDSFQVSLSGLEWDNNRE